MSRWQLFLLWKGESKCFGYKNRILTLWHGNFVRKARVRCIWSCIIQYICMTIDHVHHYWTNCILREFPVIYARVVQPSCHILMFFDITLPKHLDASSDHHWWCFWENFDEFKSILVIFLTGAMIWWYSQPKPKAIPWMFRLPWGQYFFSSTKDSKLP